MIKIFSNILSYIFHPLLVPTLGIILLFNSGTYLSYLPFSAQKAIYIIVFISTFVLPLSFIPFFIYTDRISSIFLKHKKERLIPLIITVIFYFFSFYILQNINAPKIIQIFILGSSLSVLTALTITFFWKISTHMIGIGGLLAITLIISFRLMVDLYFIIVTLILISGMIGTARLYLKAHNSAQVYLGIIVGFVAIYSVSYLF